MKKLLEQAERVKLGIVATSPTPAAPERPVSPLANVFRKEGDYWTISYGGTVFRLKDTKGLSYIAELLRHPGQELDAADLVAVASSAERARWVATKRIKEALRKIRASHPALGRELAARIKTGRVCSYTPDPDQRLSFRL